MDIITLKKYMKNLTYEKQEIYDKYIELCNNLELTKNKLKQLCPHTNKIKRREDGLYGEIYYYCPDCELELY